MLRDVLVQQLRNKANFAELFFQQDGASSYWALSKRNYLDQSFTRRWYGWCDSDEQQPSSSYLKPIDFILRGIEKRNVYEKNTHVIYELKQAFRYIGGVKFVMYWK